MFLYHCDTSWQVTEYKRQLLSSVQAKYKHEIHYKTIYNQSQSLKTPLQNILVGMLTRYKGVP